VAKKIGHRGGHYLAVPEPKPALAPEPEPAPNPALPLAPLLAPDPELAPNPALPPDPLLDPDPELAPNPALPPSPLLWPDALVFPTPLDVPRRIVTFCARAGPATPVTVVRCVPTEIFAALATDTLEGTTTPWATPITVAARGALAILTPVATAGRDFVATAIDPVATVAGATRVAPTACVEIETAGAAETDAVAAIASPWKVCPPASPLNPCASITPAGTTSVGLIGSPETCLISAGLPAIDTPRTEATLGTTLI